MSSKYYVNKFNDAVRSRDRAFERTNESGGIKWTRSLRAHWENEKLIKPIDLNFVQSNYRPFVKTHFCFSRVLAETVYQIPQVFGDGTVRNNAITLMGDSSGKPYFAFAIDKIPDLNFVSPASGGTQTLPRFSLSAEGERIDNITDWGLKQFQTHYKNKTITKDAIFNYVYGVLHDPLYREKYAINLKREFPRIPFYPDFQQWADWGEKLMALHIGYETVKPWDLQRVDVATSATPKPMLKADKSNGSIQLDSATQLSGIPAAAWDYRLGNRSGLEWILDQYKEKKPKDPTIREKFNTYRFADYKEKVIDLLARVTRVSVETMEIIEAMKAAKR